MPPCVWKKQGESSSYWNLETSAVSVDGGGSFEYYREEEYSDFSKFLSSDGITMYFKNTSVATSNTYDEESGLLSLDKHRLEMSHNAQNSLVNA